MTRRRKKAWTKWRRLISEQARSGQTVTTFNSSAVLSPPLILFLFSGLSAVTFLLLLVLLWTNNQTTYKRRYSQWERSFLCQRCGTLTEQE
jgi:hypothetical protein